MVINQLNLFNFGRHKELSFRCAAPVVGILGPNGAGKSTILDALEYAITAEARDPLPSYIRQGESSAHVSLDFVKNGKQGYIFRQIGKVNKRKLVWDGKEYTKAAEVDGLMREIFGADKKAIANAVFVNQGVLENVLYPATPSLRRDMLIKLVNMSFCAQRVKSIELQIKKLEATIVDLTTAIQAATSVVEDSKAAYLRANEVYVALADHTADVAYCDEFINAKNRIQETMADMESTNNRKAADVFALNQLLQRWGKLEGDYAQAKADMAEQEEMVQQRRQDLAGFLSIRSEITHYNRVSEEIRQLNARLTELLAEQKSLNPEGINLEAAYANLASLKHELETHSQMRAQQTYLEQKREREQQVLKRLQELTDEAKTLWDRDRLQAEADRLRSESIAIGVLKQHYENQQEIARCSGGKPGHFTCGKCGLSISNPEHLTPEVQEALRKNLEEATTRYTANSRAYQEMNATVEKNLGWQDAFNGELIMLRNDIRHAETKLAEHQVTLSEAAALAAQKAMQSLVTLIPRWDESYRNLNRDLMAKLKERASYKNAASLMHEQQRFSNEAETQLRQKLTEAETQTTNKRREFEEMTRLQTLCITADQHTAELEQQRNHWKTILDRPMPPAVSDLSINLNGNLEAVRGELKARQDARQQAYGRAQESHSAHTTAVDRYNDLVRRAAADAEKQKIIEDLRSLRELFDENGLPLDVVRYHFGYLANLTQQSLTQLDANFAIQLDPDDPFAFRFTRIDEPPHDPLPMTKLSGGQRVRLCTAFLFAVQQRLVKEVGLLVLDEPSVHLADTGVEALKQFLINLNEQLRNSEMQVWVVDHHEELKSGIERVLELK